MSYYLLTFDIVLQQQLCPVFTFTSMVVLSQWELCICAYALVTARYVFTVVGASTILHILSPTERRSILFSVTYLSGRKTPKGRVADHYNPILPFGLPTTFCEIAVYLVVLILFSLFCIGQLTKAWYWKLWLENHFDKVIISRVSC